MPLASTGFTLKGDIAANNLVFSYGGKDAKGNLQFFTDPNGEPSNQHIAIVSDVRLKTGDRRVRLTVYKAKTVLGTDGITRKRGQSWLNTEMIISKFDDLQGRKDNRSYLSDATASTHTFFKGVWEGTDAIAG